jgi:hypothetical protein
MTEAHADRGDLLAHIDNQPATKEVKMKDYQPYRYDDCDPDHQQDFHRLTADMAALERVSGLTTALIRTIKLQRQTRAHYDATLDALEDYGLQLADLFEDTVGSALRNAEEAMGRVDV